MNKNSHQFLEDILEMVVSPDAFDKIVEKYQEDQALIVWLRTLHQKLKQNYFSKSEIDEFIEKVCKILLQYANHKFNKELALTENEIFDSLIIAVNFLGQELNYSTVTTHYLNDIFGSIGDIILVVNKKGNVLYVNSSTCSLLEYSELELKQMNISELVQGQIKTPKLLEDKELQRNINFLSASGNLIPASLKVSDFSRPDNPLMGYVIVGRDLTMLIEFQKSREEYKLLFDNISQGFVLADYSGQTEGGEHDLRILNVNPAIEKHFGLKPDDITAKSVDIFWNKDKTITAYAADVAGGINRYHFEHYYEQIDKFFEIWMFSPKIGQCAVLFSDITDRKMAEAMYINSRSRYMYLFNNTSQILILYELSGKIIDVNQKALEVLEYSRKELLSLNVKHLYEDLKFYNQMKADCEELDLYEKKHTEIFCKNKNGVIFLFEIQYIKIIVDEKQCILILADDITEKREQQIMLQKMNKRLIEINHYSENLNLIEHDFLYSYIVNSLKSIAKVSFALINSYDEETNELVCEKISFEKFDLQKVTGLLGRKIEGYRTFVPESKLKLMQREIIGESGSLTDVTFGQMPPLIAKAISKLTGLAWFMGISLAKEEQFLGTILLGGTIKEKPITKEEFLAFAGITSNAIIRIKTEIKLQESERRLSNLIDNLPGIAYRCNNDEFWTMGFASKGIKEITGYEANEIIDNKKISYLEIVHADDVLKVKEQWELALKEKLRFVEEYRIVTKTGEIKWVWEQGTGVYIKDKAIAFEGFITDITEKKISQQQIIDKENRLSVILKTVPVGIGVVNDRIIQQVNSRIVELTGYSAQECVGMHSRFLYPADNDFSYVGEEKYRLVNEKGHGSVETRWKRKDGEIIDVILSSAPINPNDISEGVIFSVLDITESKKMQNALIASEVKYRYMAENVSDVIWQSDLNLNVTYVSSSIKKITGETPSEHLSKPIIEKFGPQSIEALKNMLQEELKLEQDPLSDKNRSRIVEIEHKHKNGHYIWVSMNVTFMRDENGNVFGIQGITRDIHSKKLIEIELEKSNRVFTHTLDMLCIAGFDGYFKTLNPAWEKALGWTIEELLSKPWVDFVHPDDKEKTQNIKLTTLDNGIDLYSFENRYICKDGSIKWLSWNSYPYNEESILIGVARDVTERKKEEEQLKSHYTLMKIAGETAIIGGWAVDLQSEICTWSDVVADIHEEPRGINPLVSDAIKYYAPEYRERITEVFAKCATESIAYDEVMQIITAKGNKKWVRTIGEAIRNKEGQIVNIYGAFQDISKEKEDEKQLNILHKRQKIISDTVVKLNQAEGINQILEDLSRVVYENSAESYVVAVKLRPTHNDLIMTCHYGVEKYEIELKKLLGVDLSSFSVKISDYNTADLDKLRSGAFVHFDNGIKSIAGRSIPKATINKIEKLLNVKSACFMGITVNEQLFGGIGVLHREKSHDNEIHNFLEILIQNAATIFQNKWYVNELKESHLRYKTFFDSSSSLIYLKDSSFRYIMVNKAFCDYFEKNETEIINKTDFDLLPKNAAKVCLKNDQLALETGQLQTAYEKIGNKIFQTFKFRLLLSGGQFGMGGYINDVTVEKQLSNDLQMINKLNEFINIGESIETAINHLGEYIISEFEAFDMSVLLVSDDETHVFYEKSKLLKKQVKNFEKSLNIKIPEILTLNIANGNWYDEVFEKNDIISSSSQAEIVEIIDVWAQNIQFAKKEADTSIAALSSFIAKLHTVITIPMVFNGKRIAMLHVSFLKSPEENASERLKRLCDQLMIIIDRKRSEENLKQTQVLLKETQTIANLGGWSYNIEKEQLAITDTLLAEVWLISSIKNGGNTRV